MKKLTIFAVMAAMATTAFAQDDLVKQAKKLSDKGQLEEAVALLTPALTSDQTLDKAKAWNTMSEIQHKIFMVGQQIDAENKVKQTNTPYDTTAMYNAFIASLEAAMKCDEFDRQPDEKGKVKLTYRKPNQDKFFPQRLVVLQAGQHEYQKKNYEGAMKAWGLYVDSNTDPLFTGIDMTSDNYLVDFAYNAGLLAYNTKHYDLAMKYAAVAAKDAEKAKEANELVIFSMRDGAKNAADSAAYVNKIKELHKQDPAEERYFNLLQDYYVKSGNMEALGRWAEEEIALNPQNRMAWALKGEVLMNAQKWDDAVTAYVKAAEIDPTFIQVIFNAGVCLNSKAIDMKDKLADKKTGNLTTENFNKIKEVLKEAQKHLEKARELDPSQEKVKWAYPLYQIYYTVGDKEKSAEMEALLENK